jgi:hypothetical protein
MRGGGALETQKYCLGEAPAAKPFTSVKELSVAPELFGARALSFAEVFGAYVVALYSPRGAFDFV